MSTNHTPNFNLCQWLSEDPVLRTDFNADNQKIEAALSTIPRMAVGNYGGTGVSGKETPNTLTFDFQPMLVVIMADGGSVFTPANIFIRSQSASSGLCVTTSSADCLDLAVTWSGNSISWYATDPGEFPRRQLNQSGKTYCYFAIGV